MSRGINRRNAIKAIGATGIGVSIAGCGEIADLFGDGDEDARVGVLQPASGDLGDLGEPIQQAGALPGTHLEDEGVDYEIEIREEDTETDPETGVDRAQAIADAGIPSITGAASSSVTLQVADEVYLNDNVVGISPASTSPQITDLDGDYVLRTCPSDALQTQVLSDLAEEDGLETASTLYETGDYGEGLSNAFEENFNGEVFETEAFELEQASYTSELESVLADDPDLLLIVGYPDSGQQIFLDYYQNYDPEDTTIYVTDGLQSNDLPDDVGTPLSNVRGTAPLADGPAIEFFEDLYEDEYGSSPGVFTAQAYDATAVHILAQLRADELTGEAVSQEIREVANPGGEVVTPENLADGLDLAADGEEIQYQGASSEVVFDDNGDLDAVDYAVFEFDDEDIGAGYTVVEERSG